MSENVNDKIIYEDDKVVLRMKYTTVEQKPAVAVFAHSKVHGKEHLPRGYLMGSGTMLYLLHPRAGA